MIHHSCCRLKRVTLVPIGRQEGKPDVGFRQGFAFQYTAHANWRGAGFELYQVQSKAIKLVTLYGTLRDIAPGVIKIAHALVADVTKEGWLVEKLKNEVGIIRGKMANDQSFSFQNNHEMRAIITTDRLGSKASLTFR